MKHLILLVLVLFLFVGVASANCVYNGHNYPEGTVMGPYVCENGVWVTK